MRLGAEPGTGSRYHGGATVVFTRHDDIFTVGRDGRNLHRLTNVSQDTPGGTFNLDPAFSPDGASIVYVHYGFDSLGGPLATFQIIPAQGGPARTRGCPLECYDPDWLPALHRRAGHPRGR